MEVRFNLMKWRTNDKELRGLICDNDTPIKPSKMLAKALSPKIIYF